MIIARMKTSRKLTKSPAEKDYLDGALFICHLSLFIYTAVLSANLFSYCAL